MTAQNLQQADPAGQLADELLDVYFDYQPVTATMIGLRDRDDQLPDFSQDGENALRARVADIAARTAGLAPAELTAQDQVTRAVVQSEAESLLGRLEVRDVEYTLVDTFVAPMLGVFQAMAVTGLTEQAHADAYLTRLRGLPAMLDTIAERHRAGIAAGRLPVRRLVDAMTRHLDRYLADPAVDPLRRPQPPAGTPSDAFQAERDRLLTEVVQPAVRRYRDALAGQIAPHARPDDRPGLCWLPDGEANYARLVKEHTTTSRTPEELHQTGLDVLAGLADEYAELGRRTFGTSDVTEILTRLRNDPALQWRDADELLDEVRAIIERAEAAAPDWFGKLPGQRCVVEAVPEVDAPGAVAAYYMGPALDGSRPGTYFANTHQANTRSRCNYEAITFHEAVPGHHFQISLAQELTELPMLRRLPTFGAYCEGWGLYTERLADEMGLYTGDIDRLGMLSDDSTRATRLVVDTGLHAMGWSRQQALDFMLANTARPVIDVESEIDRYIAAPGQALAYMVGRLEIQRIRADAERALGDRFDIRAFHDTVLGSGALPLSVLDELVNSWVTSHA